jgi:hypothetical protein
MTGARARSLGAGKGRAVVRAATPSMHEPTPVKQHSPLQSLLLHLIPGLVIGAVYFALTPLCRQLRYPSIMALMGAVAVALIPLELGWLLHEGRKRHVRFSLRGIVLYRRPIPLWQYFVWIPGLFVVLGLIFIPMKPVDALLQRTLFAWAPVLQTGLQTGYSRSALIVTYAMVAVFGAVVGPLVEELYFRGYLLPRMKYAGRWATPLHCLLFGLYHVWTPWMLLTRTVGTLPLAYAARWRNLYVGIAVHVLVNFVDVVAAVSFVAGM